MTTIKIIEEKVVSANEMTLQCCGIVRNVKAKPTKVHGTFKKKFGRIAENNMHRLLQ